MGNFTLTAPTYVPRRTIAEYLAHDPYESVDEGFNGCVISTRVVRARVAHDCHNPECYCETGRIEPGEQYQRAMSIVDGSPCVTRVCLYCMDRSLDAAKEPTHG